jgi:hypothetical protein
VVDRIDKLNSSLALVMAPWHQRWRMLVCGALVVTITAVAAPFAAVRLRVVNGFIPATDSVVFVYFFTACIC